MKQYLLFVFDDYHPEGGWNDFIQSFDSEQGAIDCVLVMKLNKYENYQIVDIQTGLVTKKG